MRFAVIEVGRFPVFFFVTVLTLSAQVAFMLVFSFMAGKTFGRRLPVFLQRGVTVCATDLAIQVPALQDKAGNRVVEVNLVKYCNARFPPLVFGVTLLACLLFLHQAVVSVLVGYILRDFFVTIFAQPGLSWLVELLVAFGTFTFI